MKDIVFLAIIAFTFAQLTQTPTLCAFNKFGTVPGSRDHKFKIVKIPAGAGQTYNNSNFDVSWHEVKHKYHKFFRLIGKGSKSAKAINYMNCTPASKEDFGKVCNYQPAQVQEYYNNAFGSEKVYRCKIPNNHFGIFIRFVLQLSNFTVGAGGRWSVFTGIHKYKDIEEANKIIAHKVVKFNNYIKKSSLTTFDINSNLNIIPDFIKGTLSYQFNKNINSPFVQEAKEDNAYPLSDVGFIKVIPSGTEFIIGAILNGTTTVKQICDNFRFTDAADCKIDLATANLKFEDSSD